MLRKYSNKQSNASIADYIVEYGKLLTDVLSTHVRDLTKVGIPLKGTHKTELLKNIGTALVVEIVPPRLAECLAQ